MAWITHPLKLESKYVILEPLEESTFEALVEAGKEEIIWTYMPVRGFEKEKLLVALKDAIAQRDVGTEYPLVVIDKVTGKIIGSTRLLKLNEEHKNLEIGWTWYSTAYWGKGHNEECKLLLLKYCFEVLKTVRVQIVASEKNSRSRKAIERVGGKFEGVLRHMVIRNGDRRSVAYYSILEEEWPAVKLNLETLIAAKFK